MPREDMFDWLSRKKAGSSGTPTPAGPAPDTPHNPEAFEAADAAPSAQPGVPVAAIVQPAQTATAFEQRGPEVFIPRPQMQPQPQPSPEPVPGCEPARPLGILGGTAAETEEASTFQDDSQAALDELPEDTQAKAPTAAAAPREEADEAANAPAARQSHDLAPKNPADSLNDRRRQVMSALVDVVRQNRPVEGKRATEVQGLSLRAAEIVGVRADGMRILARLEGANRTYAYTLRKDGTYRREGIPDKRAPVLAISQ